MHASFLTDRFAWILMLFSFPRLNNICYLFRDWMKRLNIKSVFTHHSQNQQPQQEQEQQHQGKSEEAATSEDGKCEESGAGDKSNCSSNVAFPGMVHTPPSLPDIAANEDSTNDNIGKDEKVIGGGGGDNNEDEEEIDDDEEEHSLKIDE